MGERLKLAIAAAAGLLAGVLLVVGLGGASGPRTVTERVEVPATASSGGTVVVTTAVPRVVGQRLDVAVERLARARFEADVEGGGLFGIVDESNWQVTGQDPAPGTRLEQGSLVELQVERR